MPWHWPQLDHYPSHEWITRAPRTSFLMSMLACSLSVAVQHNLDPKEGDDRWFGGAQVRVHPIRYLAVEGSVDYRRNDFGDTRVHSYPVQGSLMIYPLGLKRISPFILGGGGWYFTTVTGPGGFDDTQQRFGGHVGGGVQIFVSNHVSVDASYRHIWLEKIESKNVSLDDKKFNDNGHMVTVGLNLHF